mmetsp:Transcript_59615/g.67810  ORF Transcript_59615/g.67810 Transcript_59615/m.67810 type:complete len:399 (-) Transcript_59615:232-1428(-)|eukprot:CAMPEP_0115040738 /NCGR_PEP_ID=MMETSP0216-20121206/45004_1 /TAXON_ID=223996 /ORGANISM="Protocruzia adherens, Strain Boccale" /LENGTH=398 /DNA_ID=CAMNT_0002422029 /DNA_START=107 /DNA_END=1303 /DNA_ORIENTATION=-
MSRPSYQQSTLTSQKKASDGYNTKDKLMKLQEQYLDLKKDLKQEVSMHELLEKQSSKNLNAINGQIKSLKKAFNALTDVVMEEFEGVKTHNNSNMQKNADHFESKIETIFDMLEKLSKRQDDLDDRVDEMGNEFRQAVDQLGGKIDKYDSEMRNLFEVFQGDNTKLYDQLKVIVSNNSTQLEILGRDTENLTKNLNSNTKITNETWSFTEDLQTRLGQLDETLSNYNREYTANFLEIKDQHNALVSTTKVDQEHSLAFQADFQQKLADFERYCQERFDRTHTLAQQRIDEMDISMQRLRTDCDEQIEQAKKLASNLSRDVYDRVSDHFDVKIMNSNKESDLALRKIQMLEDLLASQRKEVFNSLSEVENSITRKNDLYHRAFHEISKQLKIANPIYVH